MLVVSQKSVLAARQRARARGFTLVELITIMVLLGILAAAAMPRFADRSGFESRGFRDETVALLRFAQKSAIAQRHNVCAAIAADGISLTIATSSGISAVCTTSLALPFTPRGGSGLAPAGTSLKFLASGATDAVSDMTFTVSGSNDIHVDAITGYVR